LSGRREGSTVSLVALVGPRPEGISEGRRAKREEGAGEGRKKVRQEGGDQQLLLLL
jgi:hypothetical protein